MLLLLFSLKTINTAIFMMLVLHVTSEQLALHQDGISCLEFAVQPLGVITTFAKMFINSHSLITKLFENIRSFMTFLCHNQHVTEMYKH